MFLSLMYAVGLKRLRDSRPADGDGDRLVTLVERFRESLECERLRDAVVGSK